MTEHTRPNPIEPVASLTEIYFRTAARLMNAHAAATQSLLRQSSELFSIGADQAAHVMRHATDTMSQFQNAVTHYAARQARQFTLQWRRNTDAAARQVEESTDIVRAAAERETEVVTQAASTELAGSRPAKASADPQSSPTGKPHRR